MGWTTKAGFAVAVVDPLPCMRAGLTLYLERTGNYRVVLSVATGEGLIAALEGGRGCGAASKRSCVVNLTRNNRSSFN